MGKKIETKINKFRSMTADVRKESRDECALSSHFDIFRNGRLSPNRTYTTFTNASEKVVKFLYAKDGSSAYTVYGLGDDGTGKPEVYKAQTGATAWTSVVAMSASVGFADNVFFEYKNYLYGWQNGDSLWRVGDITATITATNQYQAITYTNVAQPVHHKADDIAYFFQDNKVHKLDNTTWTSNALTLPDNMKIVGGASYGNYLTIVCSPIEPGTTNSVMYLWDRDSSLTTISDKIDLGFGEVVHVSEAEDGGIFITQQSNALTSMGSYNNSVNVKYFNGFLETIEIPNGTEVEYFSEIKLFGNGTEDRNTFYFPARLVTRLATETRNVIFAVKRTPRGLSLVVGQEITGVTTDQNINGIFTLNGHWYVSYDTNAVTLVTKNSSLYQTAIYESLIFATGDPSLKKDLNGITITTSPLPTAGQVVLKYRKDEEAAWSSAIITNTTDNSISISAVAGLPTGYKEIQFRIESTGGAEITSLSFLEEITGKRKY